MTATKGTFEIFRKAPSLLARIIFADGTKSEIFDSQEGAFEGVAEALLEEKNSEEDAILLIHEVGTSPLPSRDESYPLIMTADINRNYIVRDIIQPMTQMEISHQLGSSTKRKPKACMHGLFLFS